MSSNYPPGVTGHEPHIAGHDSQDGDDREIDCPQCHWHGLVATVLIKVEGGIIQEWTCPECEHDDYVDVDPEDYAPDYEDDRDWWEY